LGPVGAAVIGDDHLASDIVEAQKGKCLIDAVSDRFHLVKARHDDRQLRRPEPGIDGQIRLNYHYLLSPCPA